ncbi:MAG: 16S rRNA (cytosine(1402)-N(4))-methyltransferase RsmH [Pseudomonadota bacterium]
MVRPSAPHSPVLLNEVLAALAPEKDKTLIDGTFGAGGYSSALLEAGAGRVIGIDRDPNVRVHAARLEALYGTRFEFISGRFSGMVRMLAERDLARADGVVLDLGVSSMQLDEGERGFSFQTDGPLDMRMGHGGPSAAAVVNEADEASLKAIIRRLGDEPQAGRIAAAIVRARGVAPIERTSVLAKVIEQALGGRGGRKIHPATRTFQALRIFINEELDELAHGLAAAERLLSEAGILAVVSFHSLEDKIVKAFMAERSGRVPQPSRHVPVPARTGPDPSFTLVSRRVVTPRQAEIDANPRARSARLRIARRTGNPAHAGTLTSLLPDLGANPCDFSQPSS